MGAMFTTPMFGMAIIGAIGTFIIIAIYIIVKSLIKRDELKSINTKNFNEFVEELRRENAEIKETLQIVKGKVEAIDKMMRDI